MLLNTWIAGSFWILVFGRGSQVRCRQCWSARSNVCATLVAKVHTSLWRRSVSSHHRRSKCWRSVASIRSVPRITDNRFLERWFSHDAGYGLRRQSQVLAFPKRWFLSLGLVLGFPIDVFKLIAASPFLGQQHGYADPAPTEAYYALAEAVGCFPGAPSANYKDTVFNCLLKADTNLLQSANVNVSSSGRFGTWAFLPVTDGVYIQNTPSKQLPSEQVNGMNMLVGVGYSLDYLSFPY